jgi:hypothetical protein
MPDNARRGFLALSAAIACGDSIRSAHARQDCITDSLSWRSWAFRVIGQPRDATQIRLILRSLLASLTRLHGFCTANDDSSETPRTVVRHVAGNDSLDRHLTKTNAHALSRTDARASSVPLRSTTGPTTSYFVRFRVRPASTPLGKMLLRHISRGRLINSQHKTQDHPDTRSQEAGSCSNRAA